MLPFEVKNIGIFLKKMLDYVKIIRYNILINPLRGFIACLKRKKRKR